MTTNVKKIPYGKFNYGEIKLDNFYYVDKTKYSEDTVIKESIKNGKVLKRLIIILSSKKVEMLKEV